MEMNNHEQASERAKASYCTLAKPYENANAQMADPGETTVGIASNNTRNSRIHS